MCIPVKYVRGGKQRQPPAGSMYHHQVLQPMQMVAFDCLGPITETLNGRRHVILAVDIFTRFVDAKAVKAVDAETFARYLHSFVGRFGVPNGILTDNAPTFVNQQVKALTNALKIKHFRSTPHHSRGNSVAERALQSLQEKISLLTSDDALNEWAQALPMAVLSLNTTEHKSVGYPPFTLMFGRKPPTVSNVSQPAYTAFDIHSDIQSDAQAASRSYYESRHSTRSFEIGDLVLAKRMGRRAKIANRFVGPYKVIRKANDIYSLESSENNSVIDRHVQDLKPFHPRESISMLQPALVSALLLSVCLPISALYAS